ncbi:MAG TPA: tryptophan--tRNA ligase, partial [Nitrospiraceae bacterium]|nr:tryptophan--tRNA ligase [Nitrospiraceae bacterium]
CVDDKKELLKHLLAYLAPIQERRKKLSADPKKIENIIRDGSNRAGAVAAKTMEAVKKAMKL